MFKSDIYRDCPLVVQEWNGDEWEDLSGWGRFDSVEDLYACMGNLFNKSDFTLCVEMLAYYDKWENIDSYKDFIKKDFDNLCSRIASRKGEVMYRIMYQEV